MNEQQMSDLVEKIMKELKDNDLLSNNKNKSAPDAKDSDAQLSFPVEVSARHIHLSQEHMQALFGDKEVGVKKELSQPGQFQADIRVTLIGPKGVLQNIAVLGPSRHATQVELSMTDARVLGINPPVRDSGDIAGSSGVVVSAQGKAIELQEGVIIAKRHIHMTPADARARGVDDKALVQVRVNGDRPLIFDDVLVRVSDRYRLAMHIDFDEANACGCRPDTRGTILLEQPMNCPIKTEQLPENEDRNSKQNTEMRLDKKLITEVLVKEKVGEAVTDITVSKHSIITPLAMDIIRERNIQLKRM